MGGGVSSFPSTDRHTFLIFCLWRAQNPLRGFWGGRRRRERRADPLLLYPQPFHLLVVGLLPRCRRAPLIRPPTTFLLNPRTATKETIGPWMRRKTCVWALVEPLLSSTIISIERR